MSKNAVAKKESTELTPIEGYEDTIDCALDDSIPFMNFSGKLGHYETSLGDETSKSVACVILRAKDTRVHFSKPYDELAPGEKAEVECRSDNGLESEDGKFCAGCELSIWKKDEKGKNYCDCPVRCELRVVTGGVDGVTFNLTIKGSGYSHIQKYLKKFRVMKRPTFSVETVFAVTDHPNKMCFIPLISLTKGLGKEEIAAYSVKADECGEQFSSQISEETEEEKPKGKTAKKAEKVVKEVFDDKVPF